VPEAIIKSEENSPEIHANEPTEEINKQESVSENKTPSIPNEVEISKEKPAIPTEPRVIEQPQILGERNARKISALSLKSIQKKQEIKQEQFANQPEIEQLPTEIFSEEEMKSAWQEYTHLVEAEGKYNLLSHLTMGIPKLEDSTIHLEFPNHTIKTEVERAQHELLVFLREKLQNHEIILDITVNEEEEKKYAYSPREKFERMKEINPLIDELRREFDLDL